MDPRYSYIIYLSIVIIITISFFIYIIGTFFAYICKLGKNDKWSNNIKITTKVIISIIIVFITLFSIITIITISEEDVSPLDIYLYNCSNQNYTITISVLNDDNNEINKETITLSTNSEYLFEDFISEEGCFTLNVTLDDNRNKEKSIVMSYYSGMVEISIDNNEISIYQDIE